MNEKEIGFRIREVRKSQNMTMKEFGEKLNLTNAMISMLESGKAELSAKNRQAILRTFNVNPNWLDYGKGDMFIKLDANKELAIEMAKIFKLEENDPRRRIIKALLTIPSEDWDSIMDSAIKLATAYDDTKKATFESGSELSSDKVQDE